MLSRSGFQKQEISSAKKMSLLRGETRLEKWKTGWGAVLGLICGRQARDKKKIEKNCYIFRLFGNCYRNLFLEILKKMNIFETFLLLYAQRFAISFNKRRCAAWLFCQATTDPLAYYLAILVRLVVQYSNKKVVR